MAKPYIVITGVKTMLPPLYLVNLPHNCTEKELAEWVESSGFQIASVRIIRDLVAGASPAFAYIDLQDASKVQQACELLNGKKLRSQNILVSRTQDPWRTSHPHDFRINMRGEPA